MKSYELKYLLILAAISSCGPTASLKNDDTIKDPHISQDDGAVISNEQAPSATDQPKKATWSWPKEPLVIEVIVEGAQPQAEEKDISKIFDIVKPRVKAPKETQQAKKEEQPPVQQEESQQGPQEEQQQAQQEESQQGPKEDEQQQAQQDPQQTDGTTEQQGPIPDAPDAPKIDDVETQVPKKSTTSIAEAIAATRAAKAKAQAEEAARKAAAGETYTPQQPVKDLFEKAKEEFENNRAASGEDSDDGPDSEEEDWD